MDWWFWIIAYIIFAIFCPFAAGRFIAAGKPSDIEIILDQTEEDK